MKHREGATEHGRLTRTAIFRFYEELNDFLPEARRKREFAFSFSGTPSVKDAVEAIGIPHPEIDLLLVDGRSVGFEHRLTGGERVAVYPVFEGFDISPLVRLRSQPLRNPAFLLDVHLRRLARYLRMLGIDAAWEADLQDEEIVLRALKEHRIILSRDRALLRDGRVTHARWVRATDPFEQLVEVVGAFQLGGRLAPFSRCMACNVCLVETDREAVAASVPETVLRLEKAIRRCPGCDRVYWEGSHVARMQALIDALRARLETGAGDS